MSTTIKPFAPACERNREPIYNVLQAALKPTTGGAPLSLLEIGSGTGQHAVYFAQALPQIRWQPSERQENLPGIELWRQEAQLDNLLPAIELDVSDYHWPAATYDLAFSANTAHIMAWPLVERLFAGVGRCLKPGGQFFLYGPFNYGGDYTSESNQRFDVWLKARDPQSAIRDFEQVVGAAQSQSLTLQEDHEMPANNRFLQFIKGATD